MPYKDSVSFFIPGADYLSDPVFEKLIKFIDHQLICVKISDFGGQFHPIPTDHTLVADATHIIDSEFISSANLLSYKNFLRNFKWILTRETSKKFLLSRERLLNFLEQYDPVKIYTISDQNLFCYLLKDTEFESRIVIIQPALVTYRPMTIFHLALFGLVKLLNKIDRVKWRAEELNWGKTVSKGIYLLWSELEDTSHIKGKCLVSGSIFMPEIKTESISNSASGILVIAPNFLDEGEKVLHEFSKSMNYLLKAFPSEDLLIKRHPADKIPLSFHSHKNWREIKELDQINPIFIISTPSALVIHLRRRFSDVLILNISRFGQLTNLYLNPNYFCITSSSEQIIQEIQKSLEQGHSKILDPIQSKTDKFIALFKPSEQFYRESIEMGLRFESR